VEYLPVNGQKITGYESALAAFALSFAMALGVILQTACVAASVYVRGAPLSSQRLK
jgi:hypothetical protein